MTVRSSHLLTTLMLLAASLSLAGCATEPFPSWEAPPAPPTGPPTMAPTSATVTTPVRVIQTLDAGSYTYLEVALEDGPAWVATLGRPTPSNEVRLQVMGERQGFHSARLGRRFDHLLFAIVTPVL